MQEEKKETPLITNSGDRTRAGIFPKFDPPVAEGNLTAEQHQANMVRLFKENRSKMLAAQPEPKANRTPGVYIKNKMDYDCFKNTEKGWNL